MKLQLSNFRKPWSPILKGILLEVAQRKTAMVRYKNVNKKPSCQQLHFSRFFFSKLYIHFSHYSDQISVWNIWRTRLSGIGIESKITRLMSISFKNVWKFLKKKSVDKIWSIKNKGAKLSSLVPDSFKKLQCCWYF